MMAAVAFPAAAVAERGAMATSTSEGFRAHWEGLLAGFRRTGPGRLLRDARVVELPGNVPPWTESGLAVERGDALTLLAAGRVATAEALGLWARPRFALWARIGEGGTIWKGSQDTQTCIAPDTGTVQLALLQGEWATPQGRLATPVEAYAGVTGAIHAVLLRWRGDPAEGLAALAAFAPQEPLLGAEIARLTHPVRPPPGWSYLWFLGPADIFVEDRADDGSALIRGCFDDDVGILRRPVDFPLAADTTLSWRWRVWRLPSEKPENELLQHDYVSLALEFENGRDLTWHWSRTLAAETGYACPIPTWTPRETHVVVRSGAEGLGAWQAERRRVREDYARHVGEPPGRVVAAWLIAVSLFQHGSGAVEFADVVLESGGRSLRIL